MSLFVPAADPGAAESAAGLADRMASGLSAEAPKLASLVSSGWSGQAASTAAGEAGALGRLLTGFCDRVTAAATAMRGFAQAYGELKARFLQLSAAHGDAGTPTATRATGPPPNGCARRWPPRSPPRPSRAWSPTTG